MKTYKIEEDMKVNPGEYVFHRPSRRIVMCGTFNRERNLIRAMFRGRLFYDYIDNFDKIVTDSELKKSISSPGCKGCGKAKSK
tara:strand:+ start:961 stop:1209 length:249 start_codon:yes stop_codon:yes gene_type:complete